MNRIQIPALLAAVSLLTLAIGCGGSGSEPAGAPEPPAAPAPPPEPEPEPGPGPGVEEPACSQTFDSTYDAIQQVVFENRGCTVDACHGDAAAGGLNLDAGLSWRQLVEVDATGAQMKRVQPGRANASYLFHKLAAATRPDQAGPIAGSPMPVAGAPLTEDELEALRIWIERGAPETGSVGASFGAGDETVLEDLLDACLPPAEPNIVPRLEAPDPDVGVQMEMPPYVIPAGTEHEICFAVPYDYSDVVPEEFKDETGDFYYVEYSERRADTNTHHLVLLNGSAFENANDPSFGTWTCVDGDRSGEPCDPQDLSSCGSGWCVSEPKPSVACIGYGPAGGGTAGDPNRGLTVQRVASEGFFRKLPIRGLAYWNSHAFNLTAQDTTHHAQVNFYFTDDLRFEQSNFRHGSIYVAAGTPPFTKATYCDEVTFDVGDQLLRLGSHTHKRGELFWMNLNGERIYENHFYADPPTLLFSPPLEFTDDDPATRTIEFCATYNNGVDDDGNPDPDVVTRLSRKPDRSSCRPTHCAEGAIGEPCNGPNDHAACDSSPGAGDGLCDACPITAGVTTDDEMYILLGAKVLEVE